MMKTGCTGTERPKNGTGGLRRVVLALAVLLLTCVLMAGAVSATDEEWHEVTSFDDLKSNLEDGNWTKLGANIDSDSGQISLTGVDNARFDLNGHTLTMGIVDRSAIVIGGESVSKRANLTVLDSKKDGGKVNATNNYLFFVRNGSTLTLESGKFEANYSAIAGNANGKCSNPTFTVKEGVELVSHGSVAVFLPAEGTKARITGATITGKLGGVSIAAGDITIKDTEISVFGSGTSLDGWTQGPNLDGSAIAIHKLSDSYKGGLTLTLLGETSLSSENDVVFHNYISDDQSSLGQTVVTIADTVDLNGKITSATYGENCKGDGGVFKDTNGNILLYPSLNQTGVKWTGDDESGYTLTIDEAGSYKLMDAFATTGSGIQITADDVTLDGNDKEITTAGTLKGYILNVSVDVDDTENAEGVILQKLNITGTVPSAAGTYGGVTVYAGKGKTSVPVILKGSTVDLSGVKLEKNAMNPAVYFVSAPNSQITGNTIIAGTTAGSSTRCVVVDGGSDVTVSGNRLTLGSVSDPAVAVGVEIKGNDVDKVTVSGNILATGSSSGEEPRAVKITAKDTGNQKTFTVSKNSIQFGGKGTTVEVLLSTYGITTDAANARVKLNVEENTGSTASVVMLNKGNADGNDKVLTSAITLTGNIYNPALTSPEEVAVVGGFAETGSAQPDTDGVTRVNPAPQPVYSSGGNMNNAYRVLFNDGATTLSVQTDLSSGDKLAKPETPVKDGYTFAGWYKDSACTQGWDFETGISGDMTLYAKWTAAGSSGETEATTAPTATSTAVTTPQPTKTQSTTATTSAPQATTAAGVSPTLTQAPAPVAGALFGLLAAGVLLRRRFQ